MKKENEDSESGPCRGSRDEPPVLSQKLVGVPPVFAFTVTATLDDETIASLNSDARVEAMRAILKDRLEESMRSDAFDARVAVDHAPDLLAACEFVRRQLPPSREWMTPGEREMADTLEAAITKARGGK